MRSASSFRVRSFGRSRLVSVGVRVGLGALGAVVSAGALGCSSKTTNPPQTSDGGTSNPPPNAWKAAVGAGGTLVQTFDDATWETRTVMRADLYAVACMGNLVGWAAGAAGTVAHTDDGGKTWASQASHLAADLRAIRFGDASLGVVAGDGGALAVTRDGGATWTPADGIAHVTLRGAAVSNDAGLVFVAGDGGLVLRSEDRGATWRSLAIAGAGDIHGIAADTSAHTVLAVDTRGAIWSSADHGLTFARAGASADGAPLDAVAMSDDGARALAVGAHGTTLERDASGRWTSLPSATDADLHAALVTDGDTRAYAAGDHGTLLTRATSGAWQRVTIATTATLFGLEDL